MIKTGFYLPRWYVGSRYIKQTEGSTTTEYTWIGGDAYSAPVVEKRLVLQPIIITFYATI